MINSDFEAIIFDCDGTLVDSEPITVSTLVEHVAEFGLKLDYEEALALFIGRDMPMIVKVLEERIGQPLPPGFTEEFRHRQAAALQSSLKSIPGAHQLLGSITKPFCIASNAPRRKIELNLKVTGLHEFFDSERVFSAYDIESWKPNPDLFLHSAAKMEIEPSRCVVIEDSLAGIQAGIAAGMQTIGYAHSAEVKPTCEVPFVHCLSELIEVLS